MTILKKIRDVYTLARIKIAFFLLGFYLRLLGV